MIRRMIPPALVVATLALAPAAQAKTLIVILPSDYPGSKTELIQKFAELVTGLGSGNRVIFYSANGPSQIAAVEESDDPRAKNAARRKRRLAAQFAPVRHYVKNLPATPPEGQPTSSLMSPRVLEELGTNVIPAIPGHEASVLFLGSWFYVDARDGRYDIVDRFYPADSHMRLTRSQSPFGTIGAEKRLTGGTFYYCWPGGAKEFATPAYEEDVRRFTSLYTTSQGGRIGAFSFDLSTCLQRFTSGEATGQRTYTMAHGGKVEMLRARPPIAAAVPTSMDRPGEYFLRDDVPISITPPGTTTGIAWIGAKWSASCDIDVYARGSSSEPWLFYGNVRTSEGIYNKDWQTGTGEQQYEYISFTRPIDLTHAAQLAINLYAGSLTTPPEGKLRIWFNGKVYEAPFKLEATRGNGGRLPMSGPNWLKIDIRKVVGLDAS